MELLYINKYNILNNKLKSQYMKKSTLVLGMILAVIGLQAQADTTKPSTATNTTSFTTYVDAYYRTDFAGLRTNNKTSFTNSNNKLELGMASFKVDQTFGKFAGTIDLGIGKRAEEFSYNDNGVAAAVKQAYVSFAPNSIVKFTVGKWATHIGYELLDAYSNRNYSMSYGFSYGPFFHTGVRADIALGGKSALMIGVAEPTDFVNAKVVAKMIIAQFSTGTKDDKLKAFLNYQGGKDKSQFDLVLNGVVTSKFGINYDGTVCNVAGKSWTSNALYFNYDPSSKVGFALRSEYFDDSKSAAGVGASIFQNTLSANIHFNKLTIIPELRLDNAGDKVFLTHAQAATSASGNFLIAAVYKF
jgi:hypothetical protein